MCPHARRGFFRSQNSAPRDSSAAKMATYEPAGWIYEPAGCFSIGRFLSGWMGRAGGKDNLDPAEDLHNKNPSLVALGKNIDVLMIVLYLIAGFCHIWDMGVKRLSSSR